jgi:hypothetical protein
MVETLTVWADASALRFVVAQGLAVLVRSMLPHFIQQATIGASSGMRWAKL